MTHTLYMGDCLEILPTLADKSIDAIICDLPYGITACKWDSVIPLDAMWKECKRVIKDRGAIVLFGSQPFTSALIMSNIKWFRYEIVWDKVNKYTDFLNARNRPMKRHENILIFCRKTSTYNPQREQVLPYKTRRTQIDDLEHTHAKHNIVDSGRLVCDKNPCSVLAIKGQNTDKLKALHPTQKPVALLEYLVKTYTNEGDTVLDFAAGSFTTAVACVNTNRHFIGIEKDAGYFEIGKNRIEQTLPLFAEQIT